MQDEMREAESRSCGAMQGLEGHVKDFWVLLRTLQSLKILKQRSNILKIFKTSLWLKMDWRKARVKAKTLC